MQPSMLRFITDGTSISSAQKRYLKRREWLMNQCNGPIILSAPKHGPNQMYPWAHCDAPVYQDSYLLYLTGINQFPFHIFLDPENGNQHIFLPEFNSDRVFWDGHSFATNDQHSLSFLQSAGFTHIQSIKEFKPFILEKVSKHPTWHLLLHEKGRKKIKDESFELLNTLRRKANKSLKISNISSLSWEQRATHDRFSLATFKDGIEKTAIAYRNTLDQLSTFQHEYELSGFLKGQLFNQSPFGLAFPPIVARNQNAAILHYIDCCDQFQADDLVLLDFGLRWNSMCTDISRTIPLSGSYTPLQQRLIDIVLTVQENTIQAVKPGITFDELNDISWTLMESLLEKEFIARGGTINRQYTNRPHNIGHLLGIQTHDGDPFRGYRNKSLKAGSIITIEPGLYGEFTLNGETIHCGIRIEDNILVTKTGAENLSVAIPK